MNGYKQIAQFIINNNADVNAKDNNGNTALILGISLNLNFQ